MDWTKLFLNSEIPSHIIGCLESSNKLASLEAMLVRNYDQLNDFNNDLITGVGSTAASIDKNQTDRDGTLGSNPFP